MSVTRLRWRCISSGGKGGSHWYKYRLSDEEHDKILPGAKVWREYLATNAIDAADAIRDVSVQLAARLMDFQGIEWDFLDLRVTRDVRDTIFARFGRKTELQMNLEMLIKPVVLYLTASSIYYAFFHPLAKVPGPRLYSFTQLPFIYYYVQGKWERKLEQFHNQYGPAVRFTHKDVSFITVDAFKKIYGHKNNPDKIFDKDRSFYKPPHGQVDLTTADNEGHRRSRRVLAHAFSERALRGQEDIMQDYVSKFISQLTSRANHGGVVDIVKWFNFTTFDIIGDLAFGEPFGCLDSGGYHPWVRKIFESVKIIPFAVAVERLGLGKTMYMLTPPSLKKSEEEHFQLSKATALKRIESRNTDREDFMSYILRHNDEKGMTESEIAATSRVLIIAGSETTATLLSGTTFYLLTNRDKYEKLVEEIRSSFSSKEEITIARVSQLQYLIAVFKEGLRIKDWDQQRTYLVWEKGALNVKLTPVIREKQA
ncbi:hypothetical protein ACJ41O_007391 [Fusarium nematophilum]